MNNQNYDHYGPFQHMNVQLLSKEDEGWFNEIKEKGFGSRLTRYVFSTIHSDLVTELFNKETKSTSGPLCCDFSINIDSVNNCVNNIHILSCLSFLKTAITTQNLKRF